MGRIILTSGAGGEFQVSRFQGFKVSGVSGFRGFNGFQEWKPPIGRVDLR